MPRILILSFYYEPDLCAGSFRCSALVEQLANYDIEIEIITTLPNRYASFEKTAEKFERAGNIAIHRIELPYHQSGFLDQMRAFRKFYNEGQKLALDKDYDLIFATSSRLFTAFLGATIARRRRLPLYLDLRDIFVDTIVDVLPLKTGWLLWPALSLIENYTLSSAKHINLVSKGFREYFNGRKINASITYFTNGIDKEFQDLVPRDRKRGKVTSVSTVVYAGNIGEGQGLHKIVPKLARELEGEITFTIIGDGGRVDQLKAMISERKLNNVAVLPPVSRGELIEAYQQADVLFLHLNDYSAFEKVLPSKLFEYAAMGKPIWAGVSGYSAKFIETEISNSAVFPPGDVHKAIQEFAKLKIDSQLRSDFIKKFSREKIMKEMAAHVVRTMRAGV